MRRLAHVEQHLRNRPGAPQALREELVPLLHLLLTPMTIQQIADTLGPGYTHRLVEHRYFVLRDVLKLEPNRQHLGRMALLRIVTGLDPCWCEVMLKQSA